jgi:hypothetical protein
LAVSCPQCGAAVLAGTRACQFCGTRVEYVEPVAEASAPPVAEVFGGQATSQGSAAEPSVPVVVSPPGAEGEYPKIESRKPVAAKPIGKKRARTWLVMAAIGAVMIWLFIFLAYRMLSSVNTPGSILGSPLGGSAAPSGRAPASGTSADLDVDIYPGAHPVSTLDRRDSTDSTEVTQSFVSSDKIDQVIDFYKARMVGQTSIYASGKGVIVSINPDPQDVVQVAISPEENAAGERISITRTQSKIQR